MPKRLILCAALLASGATSAFAAGINLGWNDCPDGATYTLTRTFACDTNTGTNTIVGSFVAPAGVEAMSANEIVIDIAFDAAEVPPWWSMGTGRCRPISLAGNFDFTTSGPFTCFDYWQAGAIGAIQEDAPLAGWNRARIKGVFALPAGDPRITSIPEGIEVYSFKLNINNAKTVGLGSCSGCGVEVCLVLQSIRLNQPPPLFSIYLTNPAGVQHVTWQGWSNPNPVYACPLITPAKRQTWGSIKAIYR